MIFLTIKCWENPLPEDLDYKKYWSKIYQQKMIGTQQNVDVYKEMKNTKN